jgi:hypothetical protein
MTDKFDNKMANKPYYTVEQKMMAVEIIRREGGLIGKHQVKMIQDLLESPTVSQVCIRNWWLKYKDVPPSEVLKQAYGEWVTPQELVAKGIDPKAAVLREDASNAVVDLFEKVSKAYLEHALEEEVIKATKGRDAVWAAAVSIDKVRLMREVPKEIISILPSIVDLIKKKNMNPIEIFQQMYASLLRVPNEQEKE